MAKEKMVLFGVSPIMQEKEIDHYCFGVCGKITVGGINDDVMGPLCPCRQETCEYEDKRSDIIGTITDTDGESIDIIIRKLKPIPLF